MNRSLKLFMLAALFACALPQTAGANDYLVYSCRLPDGRPAATDGWTPTSVVPYAWFSDGCSSGGSIRAGLAGDSQPANASTVGWWFDSGEAEIAGYSIVRSGRIYGHTGQASMLLYSTDLKNVAGGGYSVDYCADFAGCSSVDGRLDRGGSQIPPGSHSWHFMVGCGGMGGAVCLPAAGAPEFGSLRVDSAAFRLTDDEAPSAGPATGSLAEPGAASGDLDFIATDQLSGIHRATIEVDGAEVVTSYPSTNNGRCVRVGLAPSVNDFQYRQPCPKRQQVELSLPALPGGTHSIRARVYDAAGNGFTAFGPRTVTAAGTLSANATARFVPDGPGTIKSNYGREVRIAGTLRNSTGQPVAGASVAAALTSKAAVRTRIALSATTDENGRYVFKLRAGSNRAVVLSHAPSGAKLIQTLSVRSTLKLRAARKRVRPLGRMRLNGAVLGAEAKRGASVAIKVLSGRSWRTVGVVRASRRGAFHFDYRFRRTRHARLVFRAVALQSGDLTTSPVPSRRVAVRVG